MRSDIHRVGLVVILLNTYRTLIVPNWRFTPSTPYRSTPYSLLRRLLPGNVDTYTILTQEQLQ